MPRTKTSIELLSDKLLEDIYIDLYKQRADLSVTIPEAELPDPGDFFEGYGDLDAYSNMVDIYASAGVEPDSIPKASDLCINFHMGPTFAERVAWTRAQIEGTPPVVNPMTGETAIVTENAAGNVSIVQPSTPIETYIDATRTIPPTVSVPAVHTSEAVKREWEITDKWHGNYTIDPDKRDGINGYVQLIRMFLDLEWLKLSKSERGLIAGDLEPKKFFKGREDVKLMWALYDAWPDGLEDMPRPEDLCNEFWDGPTFAERVEKWASIIADPAPPAIQPTHVGNIHTEIHDPARPFDYSGVSDFAAEIEAQAHAAGFNSANAHASPINPPVSNDEALSAVRAQQQRLATLLEQINRLYASIHMIMRDYLDGR